MTAKQAEWYPQLLDECRSVMVERGFNARWEVVEGKHEIGALIRQAPVDIQTTGLVRDLAGDLGVKERTLWYCVQFYDKWPVLEEAPIKKNEAWHTICHKYLDKPRAAREETKSPPPSKPTSTPEPSPSYLEYVRGHFCVVCGERPAEAAHFPCTKGAGAPDWWVLPLCRKCHAEQHQIGVWTWAKAYAEHWAAFLYSLVRDHFSE